MTRSKSTPKPGYIQYICAQCGTPFLDFPSNQRSFCGHACYWASLRKPPAPRPYRPTLVDLFWAKVDFDCFTSLYRPDLGPCWIWRGSLDPNGYGRCPNRNPRYSGLAHRFAYQASIGPIPEGLTLDHLCRVHCCVNPAHLEPVTSGVNVLRGFAPSATNARKEYCKRGHPFDEANTYHTKSGGRGCRACHSEQESARWRRLRALRRGQ